jgi:DNA end-binding protein Ku
MALGRPIWSGQIRLALLSLPVKLYAATESRAKLAFHQIHAATGKRIHYEKVARGVGPVDPEEIVKGYEYKRGTHVLLSDEEIESIKLEAKRTLELTQFVDSCEIDPIYFDRPYYVVPDGQLAEDAFNVLREALKRTKKIGLSHLVMRGRGYAAALKPCGKGLVLETLRYEDELRKSDPYFAEIKDAKPQEDLVSLAEELIERRTGHFKPDVFKDSYAETLSHLVEKKIKAGGKAVVADEEEPERKGAEIIDLAQALKRSLSGAKEAPSWHAPPARRKSAPHRAAKRNAHGRA